MDPLPLLVSIHKDQTTIVNGLWTLYQVVSAATLGYVFTQSTCARAS